jgi:putative intracellular protease/amidase
MTDRQHKTIGIVLPAGFADWEYGLLAAGAAEHLGARIVFLTEGKGPVRSIGGLSTQGERGLEPSENADLDAVALIGSDIWQTAEAPDVAALACAVKARGGIVGAICGATIALAKSGLLENVPHTSNGVDWLMHATGGYAGELSYVDQSAALASGAIVTASGLAPDTFATEFLKALYPEQADMLEGVKSMFAAEHSS